MREVADMVVAQSTEEQREPGGKDCFQSTQSRTAMRIANRIDAAPTAMADLWVALRACRPAERAHRLHLHLCLSQPLRHRQRTLHLPPGTYQPSPSQTPCHYDLTVSCACTVRYNGISGTKLPRMTTSTSSWCVGATRVRTPCSGAWSAACLEAVSRRKEGGRASTSDFVRALQLPHRALLIDWWVAVPHTVNENANRNSGLVSCGSCGAAWWRFDHRCPACGADLPRPLVPNLVPQALVTHRHPVPRALARERLVWVDYDRY